MYNDYFGFDSAPFSISPDPEFLYLTDQHQKALSHLLFGVGDSGGFMVLTGEVGAGKTTICRTFLRQLPPEANVAFIVNPKQSSLELLQSILDEFKIPYSDQHSEKHLVDRLNIYLLKAHAQGLNSVLIIDEAHTLSKQLLEQLRLLTNLETNKKKLLQLILIGQPELTETLSRHDLRQLAQRITARYDIKPLSKSDVAAYIKHRLTVANGDDKLFTAGALRKISRYSRGLPRVVNLLADRSLAEAYDKNHKRVTGRDVSLAAEMLLPNTKGGHNVFWSLFFVTLFVMLFVGALALYKFA